MKLKEIRMKCLLFLKNHGAIAGILLFSFLLKLYYLYNIPHPPLIYDAHHYDVMARQFLDKGILGYASDKPNAYITPGYPLFLAFLYKIFGYKEASPLMQVRLTQIVLATATLYFLYLLTKYITTKKAALIAAFFASIYLGTYTDTYRNFLYTLKFFTT